MDELRSAFKKVELSLHYFGKIYMMYQYTVYITITLCDPTGKTQFDLCIQSNT